MSAWIMTGEVFHARFSPAHAFTYPTFMLLLDVDLELDEAQHWGKLFSIRARDHLFGKVTSSLKDEVRSLLSERLDYSPKKIFLLTYPAMFGYGFQPVSFWFCERNGSIEAILCEVNNTFGERHFYWLNEENRKKANSLEFSTAKNFHVSPFFPVSGRYEYRFQFAKGYIDAEIDYFDPELCLRTKLSLIRNPYSKKQMTKTLFRHGWLSLFVITRIHIQALRLWLKKATFFSKPRPPLKEITQ